MSDMQKLRLSLFAWVVLAALGVGVLVSMVMAMTLPWMES